MPLKALRLVADNHSGKDYLALLLPSRAAPEDAPEATVHGEGRYKWAREFALDTQEFGDSSKSYVLALSDQGARYVHIESNVTITKRKREDLASIEPPEHVCSPLLCLTAPFLTQCCYTAQHEVAKVPINGASTSVRELHSKNR